jgi:putative oxidoreductase
MPSISSITRTLLGLAFLVFGLNYFLDFLPHPKEAPPADAIAFIMPFIGAKYMALIKTIEIASGLALLSNRFVPLALTLLAPILVGITWFHISLEPSGLPIPVVLVALELATAWFYREAFAPMLQVRTAPAHKPSTATNRGTVAA